MRRVEGSRFGPRPRPYRIVLRGELGERFAAEFEGMFMESGGGKTFLWGEMDQSKLHGILERIQHYNLEIIDVAEYSRSEEPPFSEGGGKESAMSYAQRPAALPEAHGNWWALLFRGIAAVLFGLAAIFLPGKTLFVLIVLYGAFALVDGAFAIVAGIRAGNGSRRWLLLAEGVFSVLAGLIVLAWPGISALFMLYVIAFWAIFNGILRIVEAISLRREIDNEWTMALSGVLSVVLGVILVVLPGAGLLSLIWLIGVFALGVGATLIVLAFRVRGHRASTSSRVE